MVYDVLKGIVDKVQSGSPPNGNGGHTTMQMQTQNVRSMHAKGHKDRRGLRLSIAHHMLSDDVPRELS